MKRRSLYALIVFLLLLMVLPAQAQTTHFETAPCPFQNSGQFPVDCGWLIVPEDHAQPDGTTIRLAVAIIRSLNPQKAPDPVFYLAGGPGGAFVQTAPLQVYSFGLAAILAERDVVLLDQRGMGLSEPRITCRPYESALDFFAESFPTPGFYERISQCRADVETQGINPDLYTTEQNAADFAALREALGYEQVNIYGTSWGTLLGLVMLRDHPEGIRSAVLDSVLLPGTLSFEQVGYVFERAFNEAVRACETDTLCSLAYPNLRETYLETYARLQESPIEINVDGQTLMFTAQGFGGHVSMLLRGRTGVEQIPGYITAIANGDTRRAFSDSDEIMNLPHDRLPDQAPFLTMTCPYVATTTLERIEAGLAEYPASMSDVDLFFGLTSYRACEAWGMPEGASTALPASDVPTLILTGQFDPLTPPEWGQQAAASLTNAYAFEFPNLGHVSGADSCVQRIMAQFLQTPEAQSENPCIATIAAPSFILSIDVTRPVVQTSAGLLGLAAVVSIGSAGVTLVRGRKRFAWGASLRKMGWLPAAATAAFVLIALADTTGNIFPGEISSVSIIQIIVPLVIAIQAAMVFSPDDEPGLEMLLSLPRPVSWLISERLTLVVGSQSLIALAGVTLILALKPDENIPVLLLGWLPSALFLSGIALYTTLRWRIVTLGVVVAGFLWMIFGLFSGMFLPGEMSLPFPMNIIQPFLWALHLYASPADFALSDYWLNRLFLTGLGIGFMLLALRQVRDTEHLLLNMGQKSRRKQSQTQPVIAGTRPKTDLVQAATSTIKPLQQWAGIAWYEFQLHRARRGFKVMTLTFVLSSGVALLVGADLTQFMPTMLPLETMPAVQAQLIKGLILVTISAGPIIIVAALLLPLLVADSVSLDRQRRTDELLESLPLSSAVYLAGKVAGVWLAALVSVTIGTFVVGAVWWLRVGAFNPLPFLDMLTAGVLPLMLINGALGVLIGATQPSTRRAILAVIVLLILPALISPAAFSNTGLLALLPGRLTALTHYIMGTMEAMVILPPVMPPSGFSVAPLAQTIVISIVQLAFVWLAVWGWRRVRPH